MAPVTRSKNSKSKREPLNLVRKWTEYICLHVYSVGRRHHDAGVQGEGNGNDNGNGCYHEAERLAIRLPRVEFHILTIFIPAVDDASPVAPKKTRAVKEAQVKTPTISKNGLLPPKKTKEAKSKQSKEVEVEVEGQVIIDEKLEPSIADDDDPFSDDEDSEAKALARVIDTDDEDAGADNGNGALFEPGQDVGKAPKPSKIPKQGSPKPNGETGVIYVGRVPHGFYEHEM